MLAALLVTGSMMLSSAQSVTPGQYSEKWLCDLWAGAQCHQASCRKDAKEQCDAASRRCRGRSRAVVPQSSAERTAACAKAMLTNACGAPTPSECEGVSPP